MYTRNTGLSVWAPPIFSVFRDRAWGHNALNGYPVVLCHLTDDKSSGELTCVVSAAAVKVGAVVRGPLGSP